MGSLVSVLIVQLCRIQVNGAGDLDRTGDVQLGKLAVP